MGLVLLQPRAEVYCPYPFPPLPSSTRRQALRKVVLLNVLNRNELDSKFCSFSHCLFMYVHHVLE